MDKKLLLILADHGEKQTSVSHNSLHLRIKLCSPRFFAEHISHSIFWTCTTSWT